MTLERSIKRLAWVASRAICGESLNGEVNRLDADAREAIQQALDLPLDDRKKRVEQYLATLDKDDADAIRAAMLKCDPRGKDPDSVATLADLAGQLGEIEWTWPGWLPRGFVTLLAAEQDSGKSLFALWGIARSILLGDAWPDGQWPDHNAKTAKVLWCEAEAAQQLLLERAGKAGLPFVRIIFPTDDPFRTIQLDNPLDVAELRETVSIHKPAILIYDALSGAHNKRENSSDEMLPVVRSLSDLARDFNIPALLVHHVGKCIENGEISLRSIRGASAITQLARVVMALEKLDDLGWLRLRAIKCNIGRKPEPIGVRILESGLEYGAAPKPRPKQPESATEKAKKFLLDQLSDGPQESCGLIEAGVGAGFAKRTLERAKEELELVAFKQGFGKEGVWMWTIKGGDKDRQDKERHTRSVGGLSES